GAVRGVGRGAPGGLGVERVTPSARVASAAHRRIHRRPRARGAGALRAGARPHRGSHWFSRSGRNTGRTRYFALKLALSYTSPTSPSQAMTVGPSTALKLNSGTCNS